MWVMVLTRAVSLVWVEEQRHSSGEMEVGPENGQCQSDHNWHLKGISVASRTGVEKLRIPSWLVGRSKMINHPDNDRQTLLVFFGNFPNIKGRKAKLQILTASCHQARASGRAHERNHNKAAKIKKATGFQYYKNKALKWVKT